MRNSSALSLSRIAAWVRPLAAKPILRVIAGGKGDTTSSVPPDIQVSSSGRFTMKVSGVDGSGRPPGNGKKVLIIDLSPTESSLAMVIDLVGLLLEKHGNKIAKCTDPQAAAKKFESQRPNLVVIGAHDAESLGADFGLIRAIKERSPLTAVMLALEEQNASLRLSPADYLLFNPTDPNELELQVSNALFRQAEQSRELKELEINRRNELMVTGAASAAHEINNLLQTISLQLEYIQRLAGALGGAIVDIAPNLNKAFDALDRTQRFTKSILELGRARPSEGLFSMHEAIEDAVGMARERIESRGIDLAVELKAEAPQLYGDKVAFFHAILNLLINARDATQAGGKITIISWQKDGEIRVGITDTGVGIPKDVIPNIFKTFFTTKAPQKGTGLGLSIVHGVVESLGGEIIVNSKEGLGTTFTIILPQQRQGV